MEAFESYRRHGLTSSAVNALIASAFQLGANARRHRAHEREPFGHLTVQLTCKGNAGVDSP